MSPNNCYQISNLWAYSLSKKIYLPIMHVLMTSKTTIAYTPVFNKIKEIISDFNLDIDFEDKIITTDYKKSLRNSIEKTLKPKILNGCFFRFSKVLWKKARKCGLTKKLFRKEGMILIFALNVSICS